MQHEGQPLGRRERVEDDLQRAPDLVGQDRVVHRVRVGVGEVGVGVVLGERFLAPAAAAAQVVEADPGDDGGQPGGEVLHLGHVAAREPQPGLLHGVVGLVHRAEHPVGHGPQVGAPFLERRRELLLVHGVHLGHHAPSTYDAARV